MTDSTALGRDVRDHLSGTGGDFTHRRQRSGNGTAGMAICIICARRYRFHISRSTALEGCSSTILNDSLNLLMRGADIDYR